MLKQLGMGYIMKSYDYAFKLTRDDDVVYSYP